RAGPMDLSERVLRFQLALALAPYAQDSARILSRLNAQFSSWLFNAGATDLAVQYAKTGLAYGRKAFTNKSVGLYHLTARVAGFYLNKQQYDSSWKYFSEALGIASQIGEPLWIASGINNLGFLYEKLSLPDSALRFFRQAEKILPLRNASDSDLLG